MIAPKKIPQLVGQTPDVAPTPKPLPARAAGLEIVAAAHFSACAASVVKPENDVLLAADGREIERSNEDRYAIRHFESGNVTAAVADGAGGEGLFCGEWAEKLLAELPNVPIVSSDEAATWLESFRTRFSETFGERAALDYFLQKKFEREGALSTLSAVWLQATDSGARLNGLRYGDSPIFIWNLRRQPVLRLAWPDNFEAYTKNPYLVSCNRSLVPSKVDILSNIELVPGDRVVVATDGIGQFISLLAAYLDQGEEPSSPCAGSMRSAADLVLSSSDPALAALVRAHKSSDMDVRRHALEQILSGFQTTNSFTEFVKSQYVKGLLPNDDCTVIVLNVPDPPVRRTSIFGRRTRGVPE